MRIRPSTISYYLYLLSTERISRISVKLATYVLPELLQAVPGLGGEGKKPELWEKERERTTSPSFVSIPTPSSCEPGPAFSTGWGQVLPTQTGSPACQSEHFCCRNTQSERQTHETCNMLLHDDKGQGANKSYRAGSGKAGEKRPAVLEMMSGVVQCCAHGSG